MSRRKSGGKPSPLAVVLAAVCVLGIGALRLLTAAPAVSLEDVPDYTGAAYVTLEDNVPDFPEEALTTEAFETYSELDALGRCGVAYANICQELMPTEERGSIGQVRPSGWQTVRYDNVDGQYLYNRCHLIGFQLAGENANDRNLITGTRYMNVDGMLPFEDEVADYVHETGNHVLYRVTPVFQDRELVARGVRMEALSVEDGGDGVCFDVFVYNVQPGIAIDYATGVSRLEGETPDDAPTQTGETAEFTYTLNTKSKKFHDPGCSGATSMSEENRQSFTGSREDLMAQGYQPCGQCQP